MKILFKLTSRSRPENLIRTIRNIFEMKISSDCEFCISIDKDDEAFTTHWVTALSKTIVPSYVHWGLSKNKIDAINRDMNLYFNWDILVNVSDDQVFTLKGFDNIIRQNMPADLDAFLHFTDSNHNPPDALCTLSIIGRNYYKRDNYIYHPSYESVWCDNEAMEVAKMRGKYQFINEIIFDHLHPAYDKAPNDAQYRITESKGVHLLDKKNFERRKKKGFPL